MNNWVFEELKSSFDTLKLNFSEKFINYFSLNEEYCHNKHELEAYKKEIEITKRLGYLEEWYFTKYSDPYFLKQWPDSVSCLTRKLKDIWAGKPVSEVHKP